MLDLTAQIKYTKAMLEKPGKVLIIIRGLVGSGKTTLAKELAPLRAHRFEADHYFEDEQGNYMWRGSDVPKAHEDCQRRLETAMWAERTPLVVSNTSITHKSMEPYKQLADRYGYTYTILDLYDGGKTDEELFRRNAHNVPLAKIASMRKGYER